MASPSTKIFSIPLTKDSHGNPVGHTFNTKEDIEPYLKQLRDVKDSVEEICLSGHTFGLDACEAVGEVLVEIPNLKV
jgi:Ran GTPase-activating protein 1